MMVRAYGPHCAQANMTFISNKALAIAGIHGRDMGQPALWALSGMVTAGKGHSQLLPPIHSGLQVTLGQFHLKCMGSAGLPSILYQQVPSLW